MPLWSRGYLVHTFMPTHQQPFCQEVEVLENRENKADGPALHLFATLIVSFKKIQSDHVMSLIKNQHVLPHCPGEDSDPQPHCKKPDLTTFFPRPHPAWSAN